MTTTPPTQAGPTHFGVLAALNEELGDLPERAQGRTTHLGVVLHELEVAGRPLLAAASGVGKVAAAQGAAALLAAGVDVLLVVGTCGGLRRALAVGTLVHCKTAFQTDLAVRETREVQADSELLAAWQAVVPGPSGWFLTADRPVLTPWRRVRLARAFLGPAVADMETAAVAAVARRAGIPWAALRAVTDGAGIGAGRSFTANFASQAARAADSVEELLIHLGAPPRSGAGAG